MEPIKINVNVEVALSESTCKFLTGLFGGQTIRVNESGQTYTDARPMPSQKSEPEPAPQPAAPSPTHNPEPASPAPQPAAASPAPGESVAQDASSVTIDQVRSLLASKVHNHRDAIKAKLNELGAQSVTKLDPSKYTELFNYLDSLA